jgi:hypothetical protein
MDACVFVFEATVAFFKTGKPQPLHQNDAYGLY